MRAADFGIAELLCVKLVQLAQTRRGNARRSSALKPLGFGEIQNRIADGAKLHALILAGQKAVPQSRS